MMRAKANIQRQSSKGYQFSILWLKNLGEETEFDILLDGLKTTGTADRVMHVVKARNGFGGGRSFAMNLDRLILKEEGQILKKKKGRKNE